MSTRRSHYRRHNNINNLHQHRTIDADEPVRTWKRVRAIPNYFNPSNNNNGNNKSGIDGSVSAANNSSVNGNGNGSLGGDDSNENDEETKLSNKFLVPQWIPADEDDYQESGNNTPVAEEDDGDKDDYLAFDKIIINAREESNAAANHPDTRHGPSGGKSKPDDTSKLTAADIRGAVGGEEIPGMISSDYSSKKKEAEQVETKLPTPPAPQPQHEPPAESTTIKDTPMADAPEKQPEQSLTEDKQQETLPDATSNEPASASTESKSQQQEEPPIAAAPDNVTQEEEHPSEIKELTDTAPQVSSEEQQPDQEMPDAPTEPQTQPRPDNEDNNNHTAEDPAASESQSAEGKQT